MSKEQEVKRKNSRMFLITITSVAIGIWMYSVSSTLSKINDSVERNTSNIEKLENVINSKDSTLSSIYSEAKEANSNSSRSYDEVRYVCISIPACFNGRN